MPDEDTRKAVGTINRAFFRGQEILTINQRLDNRPILSILQMIGCDN